MSTDRERIALVLEHLKMNANELAISLGYPRTDRIYNIINGRNGISSSLAKDICRIHHINYKWLLGENVCMLDEKTTVNNDEENGTSEEFWMSLTQSQQKTILELVERIKVLQEENIILVKSLSKEKIG